MRHAAVKGIAAPIIALLAGACAGDPAGAARLTTDPTKAVAAVVVTQGVPALLVGSTAEFRAGARNRFNVPLDSPIAWSSTAPLVVSVSAGGTATAHSIGSAILVATSGAASDSITVDAYPLLWFEDRLPSALIAETLAIDAVALDAQGDTVLVIDARGDTVPFPVTLTTVDPSVATLSARQAVAVRAGATYIRAAAGTAADSVRLVVLPRRANGPLLYAYEDFGNPSRRQLRIAGPGIPEDSVTPLLTSIVGAEWSPTGLHVAVTYVPWPATGQTRGGVWVHTADGDSALQLSATARAPAWSPDGSLIVFMDSATGYRELYVDAPAGGRRQRLTVRAGAADHPVFSPDGGRILYISGYSQLRSIRVDGTGDQLVRVLPDMLYGAPAWSPDGRRIAVIAGFYMPAVHVLTADGSEARNVSTSCPEGQCMAFGRPTWSRDGRSVMFQRFNNGQLIETSASAATGRQTNILPVGSACAVADISPDGELLALMCRTAADGLTIVLSSFVSANDPRQGVLVPSNANAFARWRP